METILCKCGCGQTRPRFDKKGRKRVYISGHQNRDKSLKAMKAAIKTINRVRPRTPWNRGKRYIHESKKIYANGGTWNKAMRRIYTNQCMRCGWNEAFCDTHHITPRSNGGTYSIDNGVILCPNCHRLANLGMVVAEELREFKKNAIRLDGADR